MSPNPASIYYEAQAATTPRLKLVRMMFAGAIESLERAQGRIAEGDRAGFVKSINKAQNIIAELHLALDFERGGDISPQLDRLYEWLQRSLTPASLEGNAGPLAAAIHVLSVIKEGYDGIRDEDEGL